MGPEASRAARFPQQQQKPWQEGERVAVGGEEGVQQCWSGHRGLGSLLWWWTTPSGSSYISKRKLPIFQMLGNRRGAKASARGRLIEEVEGGRVLGDWPWRLGKCRPIAYHCVLNRWDLEEGQRMCWNSLKELLRKWRAFSARVRYAGEQVLKNRDNALCVLCFILIPPGCRSSDIS